MGDAWLRRRLCGLALLAGLQLLLPHDPARAITQFAVNLWAAGAVHVGLRRHRPERRLGWKALEAALLVAAVGNVGWGWGLAGARGPALLLEAVAMMGSLLLLLLAAVTFLNAHRPGPNRDGLLDAAIVLAAGGLLVSEFWGGEDIARGARQTIAMTFALLMGAVLTVGTRLVLPARRQAVSAVLLLGAASLGLGGSLAIALLEGTALRWWSPLWILAAGLVGIAALHPAMAALGREAPFGEWRVSPSRVVALGVALLFSPTALALRSLRRTEDGWILAGAAGLLTVLVLWRLGRLIAARERDRHALMLSDRWFQSLLRHAPDGVLVTDTQGRITFVSPAVSALLGLDTQASIGIKALSLAYPPDLPLMSRAFRQLDEQRVPVLSVDLRMQHSSGSTCWIEASLSDLRDEPAVRGFVINLREVTERKALEAKLSHQALHDPLTGLPNRLLFHRRVEQALDDRNGHAHRPAVLFLDIDDFKTVNDSLGHGVGDDLLKKVAQRLKACLRPEDVAARLGGDEFAVLLTAAASPRTAVPIARRLVNEVARPLALHGMSLTIQACVGIACAHHQASAASLLRDADVAMNRAKSLGKGQVALFDTALQDAAVRRLNMRADLPRALGRDELFLLFQPIVELHSGRTVASEALLRWQHPRRGTLLPKDFLPAAEETGLMPSIGRWVLEQACRQIQACRISRRDSSLSISINLSSTQLNDHGVIEDVRRALALSGLPAACLQLELTESMLLPDTRTTSQVVQRLKELGLRLAVDDFGTGYCSLSYLHRLPVDVLKIDRSFVDGLGREERQAKLTRGVVQLARTLDMQTVAEGIENAGQLARLRQLGCELGQGFLFARPMMFDDLEQQLAGDRADLPSPPAPGRAVPTSSCTRDR